MRKKVSLQIEYHEIAKEWHPIKNGDLKPTDVTFGSGKKVWWKCEKGHEWISSIANRVRGKGCPYCAGQKVWSGYNDLATTEPALSLQWHPTKNGALRPTDVTVGSGKKVWWKCEKGHEWQAAIYSRASGYGCPYCSGRLTIEGETDLATKYPEIAKQWHPTKNGDLKPTDVTSGSDIKVWWKCEKGHEWQALISSRKQSGCPYCSSESRTSFPEQTIYYYLNQITTVYNRFQIKTGLEIDIYLPIYKLGIEYDGIHFHNNEQAREREKRKEKKLSELEIRLIRVKETDLPDPINSDTIIYCKPYPSDAELRRIISELDSIISKYAVTLSCNIDVDVDRDRAKIYSQYIESEKERSLLFLNPQLAEQWHPTRNGTITPLMVTANSNKRAWWKCEKGHEWQAVISSRNRGLGCPFCSGKNPIIGKSDLVTVNPELAVQWHTTKNGDLKPTDVTAGSNKKVWWKCEKGHEWIASVINRTNGCGCPYCSNKKILIGFNDLITTNPTIAAEWHPTKNKQYTPEMFAAGSDHKAWWKCSICGYEWEARIAKRTNQRGCPNCGKDRRSKAYSQIMIERNGSLASVYPTISAQWDSIKNGDLTPETITARTNKKVWWKCEKGHEWIASVASRTNGSGCPYCANKRVLLGFNDLATINPPLADQWHPTKNGDLKPTDVTSKSGKKFWWKCEKGHEWQAAIYSRASGYGCPYCSGRLAIKGETELQTTTNPEIAKQT